MKKLFLISILLISISVKAQDYKAYNNYDFIPGDQIVFEDNFIAATPGEFPPAWELKFGQGVINVIDGERVFVITEGSYGKVAPRIKTPNYLSNSFTVECEYLSNNDEYGMSIFFVDADGEHYRSVIFDMFGNVETEYFPEAGVLSGKHPDWEKSITGVWRHIAVAYKDRQIKCYVDQYRVLVIPDCGFTPVEVWFGGNAPNRFKNVKIANGGGMNMLDKIYTDGKFVTHGILFDVNKATIKPQSMGVINEVVQAMNANKDLKLSIEGHTDSDGEDTSNQKLSEQRAEAVKKALVDLGINPSRLQTKGWGESKPIDDNSTPEGKANNRRVEFIKL